MHYLLSCLKGDASILVKAPITESNFKVAWPILTRGTIISVVLCMSTFIHFLSRLNSESASDLTLLRDKAAIAIQTLRNLGRPVKHWDDILVYLVSQCLDKITRKRGNYNLVIQRIIRPTPFSKNFSRPEFPRSRIFSRQTVPIESQTTTRSFKVTL